MILKFSDFVNEAIKINKLSNRTTGNSPTQDDKEIMNALLDFEKIKSLFEKYYFTSKQKQAAHFLWDIKTEQSRYLKYSFVFFIFNNEENVYDGVIEFKFTTDYKTDSNGKSYSNIWLESDDKTSFPKSIELSTDDNSQAKNTAKAVRYLEKILMAGVIKKQWY